jgi:plastocyanin domain-containing protein
MDVFFVNLAGTALIAGIVWYFFLSRRSEAGATSLGSAVQEIHVTVKGGYSPDLIEARPDVALRIHFRREEASPCSEEIVFPDFGIHRQLPAFETTVIELPAAKPGSYRFACGMDMMRGTLKVGPPVK